MDIDCLDKGDDSIIVFNVFYVCVVCMHCKSESQLPTFQILVLVGENGGNICYFGAVVYI